MHTFLRSFSSVHCKTRYDLDLDAALNSVPDPIEPKHLHQYEDKNN